MRLAVLKSVEGTYPWGDGRLTGKLRIISNFNFFLDFHQYYTREFVEVRGGKEGMVLSSAAHYPTYDAAFNAAIEESFVPAAVGELGIAE